MVEYVLTLPVWLQRGLVVALGLVVGWLLWRLIQLVLTGLLLCGLIWVFWRYRDAPPDPAES